MKYSYRVPASTYARSSQYTPTYHTTTQYTPSYYTPPPYTSSYTSASKYKPTQYSTTYYTPSHHTSTYKPASAYVPSYSKGSRYSSTRGTQAQEKPAPVIPVTPAKRTVHFPNDIIFQDIVRRGDLEQIGRFMRARKVRVDTVFHSGEPYLHSFDFLFFICRYSNPMFLKIYVYILLLLVKAVLASLMTESFDVKHCANRIGCKGTDYSCTVQVWQHYMRLF